MYIVFQSFRAFFPFAGVKGGLSRKSQGFLFQFRMVFQQFHQFFAALYNKILPFAVAYNPLHLGVILVPSQQEDLSLLSGALRQVVNLFTKGQVAST